MSREPTTIDSDGGADSHDALHPDGAVPDGSPADFDPLGALPRRSRRQVQFERWLRAWEREDRLRPFLAWLEQAGGRPIAVEGPEVIWRASGLNRPGLVGHLTAPRLATRMAVGVETALAHAVVDRLLGFDRLLGEDRLQLTPVEWGVWTFLILRALDALDQHLSHGPGTPPGSSIGDAASGIRDAASGIRDAASGIRDPASGIRNLESRIRNPESQSPGFALSPGDLTLDRAGPDPFNPTGLGPIVTIRWSVRLGAAAGAIRLWLPESVVQLWLDTPPAPAGMGILPEVHERGRLATARGELAGQWRAEAGLVAMPQGLGRLRIGGVLPLADSQLTGTPASPDGPVDLVLDLDGANGRFRIPATPVPDSGGRLIRTRDGRIHEPSPRSAILVTVKGGPSMSPPSRSPSPPSSASASEVDPLDVPVTLTVELGRVNLTLSRLADLAPGDVIELSRHSRAPVELTSNGRLVARGELILIDTELGVRVTGVFL